MRDDKEMAEHVMLVDLGRNDVGRVAVPGTVRVDGLAHVERFSHLMHLVSRVDGTLADGLDAFDAFDALFPAGTLTGAPKVRAMELIDGFEPVARGPYGGAVGYFALNGNADFAITIRTLALRGGVATVPGRRRRRRRLEARERVRRVPQQGLGAAAGPPDRRPALGARGPDRMLGATRGGGVGDDAYQAWREAYDAQALRDVPFTTLSGIPLEPVYGPRDGEFPGVFPYTRGAYASMYRARLWTMRMFAGFGTAVDTNRRFKEIIAAGRHRAVHRLRHAHAAGPRLRRPDGPGRGRALRRGHRLPRRHARPLRRTSTWRRSRRR